MNGILDEANEIINHDRNDDYGDFYDECVRTAMISGGMNCREYTPLEIANIKLAMKLSREGFKHKHDNLVDTAGYLDLKADKRFYE